MNTDSRDPSKNVVLITGGAGFIGGSLVRQILREEGDTHVVNLDKLTYAGNLDSLQSVEDHPRHTFVQGDVANSELVCDIMTRMRPTAIVHLAAESHVDRSIDDPTSFVQSNILGTCVLLEAARTYWQSLRAEEQAQFRFLHVSTDEVFGSLGASGLFSETTPYAPRSPYAASKAASDHMVRSYYHTFGLPTLITNCSNNFGPYQFPEKLIPLMILNAIEGRKLPVYGDGLQVRDWLFVEDHCEALRLVLQRGAVGDTYNVGGNCQRTNLEIVCAICRLVDRHCPELPHGPRERLIQHVVDRPGHDRRYAIDATKIARELNWSPRHEFESALELTVGWYLNNDLWIERVNSGAYHRERLGLITSAA